MTLHIYTNRQTEGHQTYSGPEKTQPFCYNRPFLDQGRGTVAIWSLEESRSCSERRSLRNSPANPLLLHYINSAPKLVHYTIKPPFQEGMVSTPFQSTPSLL